MPISKVGFSSCADFFSLFQPLKNNKHDDRFDFSRLSHTELDNHTFSDVQAHIPFSEDCLRAIKNLIRHYATVKQHEFIINILTESHHHLPVEFTNMVYSCYTALKHKKNIDMALLSTLGFASSRPFAEGNEVATLAQSAREMLTSCLGADYLQQFLGDSENDLAHGFFTCLAIFAVASQFWLTEGPAAERRLLTLPTFLAAMIIRLGGYWNHLGYMAQHAD